MRAAKILHLHSVFDLGGQQARAVQLMNHFGDMAHHTILSSVPEEMGAADAVDAGIKVDYPGENAPALHGKPSMWRYQKIAAYMKRFDLILSYNWGSMDGVMAHTLLGRRNGLPPLIHHEDGFGEDEADKLNWKRNWFRMIALHRADALVVPSKTLEQIALKIWHQKPAKIVRFPNGIKVENYHRNCRKDAFPGFQKSKGEIIVGTVAGLRTVKNISRLVRAVAAAGDNIRLAVAGEGPDRAAIEAEARKLGMADRLMMPGFLADPASYIGLFDIFALSSDSEQYPISLVEGMAAQCAVAATNVGDIYDMVARENREFIVDRDDAALAKAIRTLAENDDVREKLAAANRQRAFAEYDETTMFARYRQLYGSAMGRADFARQD